MDTQEGTLPAGKVITGKMIRRRIADKAPTKLLHEKTLYVCYEVALYFDIWYLIVKNPICFMLKRTDAAGNVMNKRYMYISEQHKTVRANLVN